VPTLLGALLLLQLRTGEDARTAELRASRAHAATIPVEYVVVRSRLSRVAYGLSVESLDG
jgi:hypothetical protein